MQDKINLRPLRLSDINKKYLLWVNDPSVTEYLRIGKQRLMRNDLVRYIKNSPKEGRHNYAIITTNSKLHIGNCSIYSIDKDKRKFEIGYFIGEKKFWGGHYSSMLIFNLGSSRSSANIIDEQKKSLKNNNTSLEAMHKIKKHAKEMKDALISGEFYKIAKILNESWEMKKLLVQGSGSIYQMASVFRDDLDSTRR